MGVTEVIMLNKGDLVEITTDMFGCSYLGRIGIFLGCDKEDPTTKLILIGNKKEFFFYGEYEKL